MYVQSRRAVEAESLLRNSLKRQPDNAAAAMLLARLHKDRGRIRAAAQTLRDWFKYGKPATESVIQALEMLDGCGCKTDAAAIAETEIAAGNQDVRIHAYAATYAIQLGQFDLARQRFLFVHAHSHQALEWHVPYGLSSAQRYSTRNHADFALFRECLRRGDMSKKARATLLFALGKAHDDIGEFGDAVKFFREANELARSLSPWSRKRWRRMIDARMHAPLLAPRSADIAAWTPVFILGVPRSGTTLIAELLSRHPRICNRGELSHIWSLAQRMPPVGQPDRALLDALAIEYEMQVLQDDAHDARWFIDKQPLNLLHVDLILTLWPHAKIIHCQRSARDTALSLWTQYFLEDTHAYAYDFADIAAVVQGSNRLMTRWKELYPSSIYTIRYEELIANPELRTSELCVWLGLSPLDFTDSSPRAQVINTASFWQARQTVYARSVQRWRSYAEHLPELLQFSTR